MVIEKEYIVRVTKESGHSWAKQYHIELIEPDQPSHRDYKLLAVAHDWCAYKFMINRTVRKLLKQQLLEDNPNLIMQFKVKAEMR